jgi:predicted CopG family antitoxin
LKFALNNKARIVIDDEIIYDFVEKKDVKQAVASELKKQGNFEIVVWTDKVPVEYKHRDITVKVNEDGTISYSGKLKRMTNAGNDFFILDTNAPYYIIEEDNKFYLLLGQTFKDKNEFSNFVKQMLERKWEGVKVLRKTEIKLKNAKIILCFYEYNNKRFISILSPRNSVYRSVV